MATEFLVGCLDRERAAGAQWTAAEVNESARIQGVALPELTDPDLDPIRTRRAELFAAWAKVPEGGTLPLDWN